MPRPWTMRKMVDHVVELLGRSPDSGDDGSLIFVNGPLHSRFWIWKDHRDTGIFGWSVITYDTALRDPMTRLGGMGLQIHHPQPGDEAPTNIPPPACYQWPTAGTSLSPEASEAVVQHGPASLNFVRDRHDLGLLLLADTHVHRGDVWSFTPTSNEPARLTQAVLLARHSADQALEEAAMDKLRLVAERPVLRQPGYLFRQAVADWAKQYSKATGVDLGDLIKLQANGLGQDRRR